MQRRLNQTESQKKADADVLEKRRLQNRMSQRKHRNSVKSQLKTLKAMNEELLKFKEAALKNQKSSPTVVSSEFSLIAVNPHQSTLRLTSSIHQNKNHKDITNNQQIEPSSAPITLTDPFDVPSPMNDDEAGQLITYSEPLVGDGEIPHLALGLFTDETIGHDDVDAQNLPNIDQDSPVAHATPSLDANSSMNHTTDIFDMSPDEKQYDPRYTNNDRPLTSTRTALHHAVANSHEAVVHVLLRFKADINAIDEGGKTPLHECAAQGNADLARFLLDKGAHPEARDYEGLTPLQYAAALGHVATVEVLLQYGADVNGNSQVPVLPIDTDLLKEM